jgi:hypothetical protein
MDKYKELVEFLESLPYDEDHSFAEPHAVIYWDGRGDIYDEDDVCIISFKNWDDLITQIA